METFHDDFDLQTDEEQMRDMARAYDKIGIQTPHEEPYSGCMPVWLLPHARKYTESSHTIARMLDALPNLPWKVKNTETIRVIEQIKRENAIQVVNYARLSYPAAQSPVRTAPVKQMLTTVLEEQNRALSHLYRMMCETTRSLTDTILSKELLCCALLHGITI